MAFGAATKIINMRVVRRGTRHLHFSWELNSAEPVTGWNISVYYEGGFTRLTYDNAQLVSNAPAESQGRNGLYPFAPSPARKGGVGASAAIELLNLPADRTFHALIGATDAANPEVFSSDNYTLIQAFGGVFTTEGSVIIKPITTITLNELGPTTAKLAWRDRNHGERKYVVQARSFTDGRYSDWHTANSLELGINAALVKNLASDTQYEFRLITLQNSGDPFPTTSNVVRGRTSTNERVEYAPGVNSALIRPTAFNPYTPERQQRYPDSLVIYEPGVSGPSAEHCFNVYVENGLPAWQAQVASQRATRFQTGSRTIHDMSLLNVQAWTDLHRGGIGAKQTADGTRYREAHNMVVSDAGEMKLSPVATEVDLGFLGAGWQALDVIVWPGYKANGASLAANDVATWLLVEGPTENKLYALPQTSGKLNDPLTVSAGNLIGTIIKTVTSWTIFRNKIYFGRIGSGTPMVMGTWNNTNNSLELVTAPGSPDAHIIYSDSEYFYRAVGNEVYRSVDPSAATPVWQGPVRVGNNAPITGLTTYGSEEAIAVFVMTWHGLYRILEEGVNNDANNAKTIKSSFPVDVRPGMADDLNGRLLETINNEVVGNYPGALMRHTLGQTTLTSPWEDNGIPFKDRGRFTAMQDTRGGIVVACVPYENGGQTQLFRWIDGRWHHFADVQGAFETPANVRGLAWTTRQVAATARLWVCGASISSNGATTTPFFKFFKLPTSTTNHGLLPDQQYVESGTVELPIFKGEFEALDKLWHEVVLDFDPERTGVYEVVAEYAADAASAAVWPTGFVRAGSYTPVPVAPHYHNLRRWVGCSSSEQRTAQQERDEIGLLLGDTKSKSIRVRVGIQQQPSYGYWQDVGRYPVPPLTNSKLCLGNEHIVAYGLADGVRNAANGNNAGLYANYQVALWQEDHWAVPPLEAYSLTDVRFNRQRNTFLLCGSFAAYPYVGNVDIVVEKPTLLEWNPRTQEFRAFSQLGEIGLAVEVHEGRVFFATRQFNQTLLYRLPEPTPADTAPADTNPLATVGGVVTASAATADGASYAPRVYFKTTGTSLNGIAGTLPAGLVAVDPNTGSVASVHHDSGGTRNADALGCPLLAIHFGSVWLAGHPRNEAFAIKFEPGIAVGQYIPLFPGLVVNSPISALTIVGEELFFAAGNYLCRYALPGHTDTSNRIIRNVRLGQSITDLAGVNSAGLFVAAYPPDERTLATVNYLYANEPLPRNRRPSPIVRTVGLKYLELPDELRSYVVTLKLADQGENQAHLSAPLTAERQLQNLLRLCRTPHIYSIIAPDGTPIQAILSSPRWQQVGGGVVSDHRPEIEGVEYRCTVTVQEVSFRKEQW